MKREREGVKKGEGERARETGRERERESEGEREMGERQPPGQNRAWIGGGCIGLRRNKGILFEFSPVIDSFLKSLMF